MEGLLELVALLISGGILAQMSRLDARLQNLEERLCDTKNDAFDIEDRVESLEVALGSEDEDDIELRLSIVEQFVISEEEKKAKRRK